MTLWRPVAGSHSVTVQAGGQSVFLADQGCPNYLKWTLTNTPTGAVPATGYCYYGNQQINNLPAGQYVLEWTGSNNASGPYSFNLSWCYGIYTVIRQAHRAFLGEDRRATGLF
ncbi:hypothetical protein ACVWYS_000798 [Arthrobacter sp. TE12231]